MKARFAPFLVLLEARYAPLLFAVAPQAYAVYLWLFPQPYDGWGELFAVAGAIGYEFVYVGAIAWAEEGRSSVWTWATAVVALLFSVVVAYYVYRTQGAWAWLHAGFPLVAFTYTLNMYSKRSSATPVQAVDEIEEALGASALAQIAQANQRVAGFVYVLRSEAGQCKIGCARNVEQRTQQIAAFVPFKVEVAHTIATDDMYATESRLHRYFELAGKRLNGEWFALTSVDLSAIRAISADKVDVVFDRALELLATAGVKDREFDGAFWLQQATAKKPLAKSAQNQALLDEMIVLPLATNGTSAYTCPHCNRPLRSKQALGAAVANGHCPACKAERKAA